MAGCSCTTRRLHGGNSGRVKGDLVFSFSLATMLLFVSYPILVQRSIINMMSDYYYFQSQSKSNSQAMVLTGADCHAMQCKPKVS